MLSAGRLMVVRDPRFSLHDGFSLKIANITAKDAGEYLCQIADTKAKDQVHSVQVLGRSSHLTMSTASHHCGSRLINSYSFTTHRCSEESIAVKCQSLKCVIIPLNEIVIVLFQFNCILYVS